MLVAGVDGAWKSSSGSRPAHRTPPRRRVGQIDRREEVLQLHEVERAASTARARDRRRRLLLSAASSAALAWFHRSAPSRPTKLMSSKPAASRSTIPGCSSGESMATCGVVDLQEAGDLGDRIGVHRDAAVVRGREGRDRAVRAEDQRPGRRASGCDTTTTPVDRRADGDLERQVAGRPRHERRVRRQAWARRRVSRGDTCTDRCSRSAVRPVGSAVQTISVGIVTLRSRGERGGVRRPSRHRSALSPNVGSPLPPNFFSYSISTSPLNRRPRPRRWSPP